MVQFPEYPAVTEHMNGDCSSGFLDPPCSKGYLYDINLYNLHFVTGLFGRPEDKILCKYFI